MSLKVVGGKAAKDTNTLDELIETIRESKLDSMFVIGFRGRELVLFSSDGLSLVETLGALEASKFYIMEDSI